MRKEERKGPRNETGSALDQLERGERRLAIIERLFIDVATVVWLIASLIAVLFLGAIRAEVTFLTGLILGLRMRR